MKLILKPRLFATANYHVGDHNFARRTRSIYFTINTLSGDSPVTAADDFNENC